MIIFFEAAYFDGSNRNFEAEAKLPRAPESNLLFLEKNYVPLVAATRVPIVIFQHLVL